MPDKPEKIKLALCVRTELPDSSNSWQGCAYAHLHVSLYASEVEGDAPGAAPIRISLPTGFAGATFA